VPPQSFKKQDTSASRLGSKKQPVMSRASSSYSELGEDQPMTSGQTMLPLGVNKSYATSANRS